MKFVYCNKAKAEGYAANWPAQALADFQDEVEDFHKDYTAISRQDPVDPRYLPDICRFHLHEGGIMCNDNHKETAKRKRRQRQKAKKAFKEEEIKEEIKEEKIEEENDAPPPPTAGAAAVGSSWDSGAW